MSKLPVEEWLAWVRDTFPDETLPSILRHLNQEAHELTLSVLTMQDTAAMEEAVDVLVLALQASVRVCGDDLPRAMAAKLKKNRARTWAKNDRGVYEHDRTGEPP